MFQKNVLEEIKTRILYSIMFSENRALHEIIWKYFVEWAGHKWQYGACALYAGCL